MRVSRLCGAALLAWLLGASAAVRAASERAPDAEWPILAGTLLRAALESLRDRGLHLVYSDALVGNDLRVAEAPDPDLPLADQAAALLEPVELRLERTAPDLWYVVRALARPSVAPPEHDTALAMARSVGPVIEEILVVASRYRLVRDLYEPRRVDHQELAAIPSIGRDVLRAASQLPGVASSGVSARNYVRGGNTNEVLYRVGGVPLIEPFHMSEFQAFFSAVNPDIVGAMNLYSAGFPATLGSRLAGVVDIELTEPERSLQGAVNVNMVNAAVHAQGRDGAFEWLASARRSTLDQLLRYLDEDYGRPRFNDELLQLRWDGARTAVTTGLLSSNDEMSLRDPGAGERAGSDFHNLAVWTRVEFAPSDSVDLALLASWTGVENERDGTLDNPVDAVGVLREARDFEVFDLQPSLRMRLAEGLVLQAGVEAQRQSGEFDINLRSEFGPLGAPLQPQPVLIRHVTSDREGELFSAYVSLQQSVTDRLQLEYGVRHDLQDNDPIHDHQTSPRLQARYRVNPALALYLNAGRYAQHQNLYELQLDDGLLELQEPQVAQQLSLGGDWTPRAGLAMRVEAYVRDVDDPWRHFENLYNRWVLLPELHADRVELRPDATRAYGVEFTTHWERSDSLAWSGTYAYASTEGRLEGRWRPRPWDQAHALRLGLNWRPAHWQVDVLASWHSGWATNARFEGDAVTSAAFYDERLPDYFSLDVHVARRFPLPRSVLEVYADLSNATFHDNVGGEKFAAAEEGLVGSDRSLLDPIPAIGVSWSW